MNPLFIYTDGASRGNPGHASYGVCIQDADGNVLLEVNDYLGTATNNVAEYSALIRGLEEAKRLGAKEVNVFTDSELVARQFDGTYRIKDAGLKTLLARAWELRKDFKSVAVKHIPRSSHPGNKRADKLANQAIDRALS